MFFLVLSDVFPFFLLAVVWYGCEGPAGIMIAQIFMVGSIVKSSCVYVKQTLKIERVFFHKRMLPYRIKPDRSFFVIAPFGHIQACHDVKVDRIPALFSHLPIITLLGWPVGLATRSGEPLRRSTGQV